MSEIKLDVDQASELKAAFRREDWSNEEIKMLCERKGFLSDVRRALCGHATITTVEHVIDLDTPFVPDGWKVEEHQKGGSLTWDASKIELWLAEGQKIGNLVKGNMLRKELSKKPVLNACVLDYLLANPDLIPEEWKGRYVFFWGTIYRSSDGGLHVRYLVWLGDRWDWGCHWLDNDWDDDYPAALRAS